MRHSIREPNNISEGRTKYARFDSGNEKTQRIKDAGDIRSKMESEKQKQDIKIRDLEIYAENREKNEQEMLDLKQRI